KVVLVASCGDDVDVGGDAEEARPAHLARALERDDHVERGARGGEAPDPALAHPVALDVANALAARLDDDVRHDARVLGIREVPRPLELGGEGLRAPREARLVLAGRDRDRDAVALRRELDARALAELAHLELVEAVIAAREADR